jgi:hypothetical protein
MILRDKVPWPGLGGGLTGPELLILSLNKLSVERYREKIFIKIKFKSLT